MKSSRIFHNSLLILMFCCGFVTPVLAQGLALHGEALLKSESPRYVDVKAPQGGTLIFGVQGTFDTLNSMNIKGIASPEIRHYTIEGLMKRHMDEPFALYPALAISAISGEKQIKFTLNPKARFSNGDAVTTRDVAFSLEVLKTKGRPNFRTYYSKITRLEVIDSHNFIFHYEIEDRELPLILALMPIISHKNDANSFEDTTLTPIIGSGAYTIIDAKVGERVIMQKTPQWWGQNEPMNIGQYNFETIRFDFYRDSQALYEAFTKGLVDWRIERDPQKWEDLQSLTRAKNLPISFYEIESKMPPAFRSYFFNIRRDTLQNRALRDALIDNYDDEFINAQFYKGQYLKLTSPFSNSILAGYTPPIKPKDKRVILRESLGKLKAAGFNFSNGLLLDMQNKPIELELIVNTREQERLAKATAAQFLKLGVTLNIRLLDAAQYEFRANHFDYDMIEGTLTNSLSPGNEQVFYWGTVAANQLGSRNFAGVKSAEIDASIALLTNAKTGEEIIAHTQKLDNLLMQQAVTLPLFQPKNQWIATSNRIGMPVKQSIYGHLPEVWFTKN